MIIRIIALLFLVSGSVYAETKDGNERNLDGKEFPWELVIDRGKINGCIYDNKFYSNGSIIVKETLPRKCRIDPNRDGYWAQLEKDELELYEDSVRAQMKLDSEALTVGKEPLNKYTAAIVRYMRKARE